MITVIHKAIDEYMVALVVEGKAGCTLEVYGTRLGRFADWCAEQGKADFKSLSANDLRDYRDYNVHLQANSNGNGTPRQNAVVVKAFSR